ncbi:hypothetical protein C0989_007181, partial [Termitomyces sp. Mn162]
EWLHYGETAIFIHLLQHPAEVVNAALAAVEELFSVALPPSTSSSVEEQAATVVSASIGLTATSDVSSQDTPTEESMELDY